LVNNKPLQTQKNAKGIEVYIVLANKLLFYEMLLGNRKNKTMSVIKDSKLWKDTLSACFWSAPFLQNQSLMQNIELD
jgi:hypothetical protein